MLVNAVVIYTAVDTLARVIVVPALLPSTSVADMVPFLRIRILLMYICSSHYLILRKQNIFHLPLLCLLTLFKHLVTLKIKDQNIIFPKLYFRQYYISRKVNSQGSVCLWTKDPDSCDPKRPDLTGSGTLPSTTDITLPNIHV